VTNDQIRDVFAAEHARLWRSLLAHTQDAEIASDAVAEAFAQAVRRGAALRDPVAWVWRAAFRIADGQLAARHRWDEGPLRYKASPDTLPDEVVALLDALARLDETDRQVVILALVAGFSSSDLARIVDASPGAVRVRLHRARRRLRTALGPDASPEGTSQRRTS
jgi:RNA polymerase sigma factor (sigma-70 family)